jgi:hypothetical protein
MPGIVVLSDNGLSLEYQLFTALQDPGHLHRGHENRYFAGFQTSAIVRILNYDSNTHRIDRISRTIFAIKWQTNVL